MQSDFKTVTLSDSGIIAHLATRITYGESRAINAVLYSGAKGKAGKGGDFDADFSGMIVLEWTMKKILTVCKKFVDKDGAEKPVTLETVESLSESDGEQLADEVEKVLAAIKKK
jgi:hypothetical protein